MVFILHLVGLPDAVIVPHFLLNISGLSLGYIFVKPITKQSPFGHGLHFSSE